MTHPRTQVGNQATAFGKDVQQFASEGTRQVQTGFKLESEVRFAFRLPSYQSCHLTKTDEKNHECMQCQKAAKTLQSFLADPEHPESALNSIPKAVLLRAKGLAIFTVIKAGFVWSGKLGSGVVIARLPDRSWSAPSCIGTTGVGFGLQIGADLSELCAPP